MSKRVVHVTCQGNPMFPSYNRHHDILYFNILHGAWVGKYFIVVKLSVVTTIRLRLLSTVVGNGILNDNRIGNHNDLEIVYRCPLKTQHDTRIILKC